MGLKGWGRQRGLTDREGWGWGAEHLQGGNRTKAKNWEATFGSLIHSANIDGMRRAPRAGKASSYLGDSSLKGVKT